MESSSSDIVDPVEVVELENTPEFQALVVAAGGKPERSMGDSVIPAEPPKWADVLLKAQNLVQDPPHLAVLVYLVKASCHVRGFSGLDKSLASLADLLDSQWETIQPLADPEDPDDPHYARVNLLRELPDAPDFISTIFQLPMVDVRGIGAFSARDIDISRGQITGSQEDRERCKDGLIRGAMQETGADALRVLHVAMQSVQSSCYRIDALFDANAGKSHGLSMDNLSQKVASCQALLQEMSGDLLDQPLPESALEQEAQSNAGPVNVAIADNTSQETSVACRLSSRADVLQALDQVIDYYQRIEPSSPVPVLAQHAREMVPKSFFEILQALAPTGSDSFTACLESLHDRPIAFLLEDSFRRFAAGSGQPVEHVADQSLNPDANLLHSSLPPGSPLDSRSDVIDTLNEIDLFFTQTEPASPIPLIVAEMKKMVQKTFSQLVADFSRSLLVSTATGTAAPVEEG